MTLIVDSRGLDVIESEPTEKHNPKALSSATHPVSRERIGSSAPQAGVYSCCSMPRRNLWSFSACLYAVACGGRSGLDELTVGASVGGVAAVEGTLATGGSVSTWGNNTGGTVVAGGITSSGGRPSTGGAPATGGIKSTGGTQSTGGSTATGGSPLFQTFGGSNGMGGTTAVGGSKAAGGTVSVGGSEGLGGSNTGGSVSAGGTTSTCVADDDCMLCAFGGPPSDQSECWCYTGCESLTPMTKYDCNSIGTVWAAYCVGKPLLCVDIVCQPQGSVSCMSGVCTAHFGTGGASGTGGSSSTGGTTAIAGTTVAGGTTSMGGSTGAGCAGNFEAIQSVTGQQLCLAKMVTITGPTSDAGSTDYQMDATEVTRGQYESWVATNPELPPNGDAACGWKSAGSYAEDASCMTSANVCQGAGCDHHPAVCVDWCDAYWYCAAVGKRLCGGIGGGSDAYDLISLYVGELDASVSQWCWACSSGGKYDFPYGNQYQGRYCVDFEYNDALTSPLPVATLSTCQSSEPGYTGVYDLIGNVSEWEDSCEATTGQSDNCLERGGWFDKAEDNPDLRCGYGEPNARNNAFGGIGFRCCSL